ncbi:hypothetical protein GCK72_010924 [Caenorhabditis remanei]|uniref:Uncharacterized protein n=1 Tax=Caenorhabditis remanei TaxID=31234 RepID=A0A6A5H8I3_CAERE|nr:hypothetical protein GCK72_010924 [Caenorhabditis remanei]KAF1762662.1 hypothetical protein GCK72_010924 [Caenorhabditis remanei]
MSETQWVPKITKPEDLYGYRLFLYQKVQGKYIEDVIKCGKDRFRTEIESLSEYKNEKFGEILLHCLEVECRIIVSQKTAAEDILSKKPFFSSRGRYDSGEALANEYLARIFQRALIEMKQQFSQLKKILTGKEFDKSKNLRNILILLAYLMFLCLYITDKMCWTVKTNSQSFPEETKTRFHSDCIQFETIIDSIPYSDWVSELTDEDEKDPFSKRIERFEKLNKEFEESKKTYILGLQEITEKEVNRLVNYENYPRLPLITKPKDLNGHRFFVYQKVQGKYIEDVIKCGKDRFRTEMESLSTNQNEEIGEILIRYLEVEFKIIRYQKTTAEDILSEEDFSSRFDSCWEILRGKIYENHVKRALIEMKQQFSQLKSILTEKEFDKSKSLRNILILLAYLMFSCQNVCRSRYFNREEHEDKIPAITCHAWVLEILFQLEFQLTNSQSFPEETKARFHSDCIRFETIIDSMTFSEEMEKLTITEKEIFCKTHSDMVEKLEKEREG